MLRADLRAITHKGAGPDAILAIQLCHTLFFAFVAIIEIVAMRQRNGRRADKLGVKAKLRAGGIAEPTVDTAGELVVTRHLGWRLLAWPL